MIDMAALLWLVTAFGYLGIFIVSLIGSASVFIPLPSFLVVVAAGAELNPFIVGVVAGIGAAVGELIGYAVGLGLIYGKKKLEKKATRKEHRYVKIVKKLFRKRAGMFVIFVFAATPLPDKIIGVVCGAIKYDLKKFFLATLLGKVLLHIALAYVGFYGLGYLI